ncbi:DNA-binding proteins Bright/BRCAA1/RBP1 and proteins containing BRIGHT domain [Rhizina undulata]
MATTTSISASASAADLNVDQKTPSVSIPNSHLRRGGDATVSRNTLAPVAQAQSYQLLTPPTSISPSLPPISRVKAESGVDHLGVQDSDMDVSDIGGGLSKLAPSGSFGVPIPAETAGAITPALLAKHYLPGILLQHGPLAIRHLTAYLISSIPGFSSISPARQRRLVVGALEGRGGASGAEGEVGGVNGNVIFEKIGWGRWDARRKGDAPRERNATPASSVSPLSTPTISAIKSAAMFRAGGLLAGLPAEAAMHHSTSYTGESGIFVQSEEEDEHSDHSNEDHEMMVEGSADNMSMDEETETSEEEDADMTDEEDWEKMGPEMLRMQGGSPITSDGCISVWSNKGTFNRSGFTRSPGEASCNSAPWNGRYSGFERSSTGEGMNIDEDAQRALQEQEAVLALVKLSSV